MLVRKRKEEIGKEWRKKREEAGRGCLRQNGGKLAAGLAFCPQSGLYKADLLLAVTGEGLGG